MEEDKLKVNKNIEEAVNLMVKTIIMKSCESECRGELINELKKTNVILSEKIKYLNEQLQNKREEHEKIKSEIQELGRKNGNNVNNVSKMWNCMQ